MHEEFMRRALALAAEPPFTSPNPRVGAVVVVDGSVVGEGSHQGAGTDHAEVVALAAAGRAARGATMYVNLEPCIHHGRRPPCAPALVEAGVARVVAAIEDPDERVSGQGFAFLRDRGVEVVTGISADEAERVNRSFLHHRRTGRPLVVLKLALTLDGRLAAPDHTSRWITGEGARARVHTRRAQADCVLVGAGTAVSDDPELTVREVPAPRQPARVVVDSGGRVPPWARIFDAGEVIVATTAATPADAQVSWKEAGAEVVTLDGDQGRVDLAALLDDLGARGWLEVLCEGGAELATSLLRSDLVDVLELHHGSVMVGRGGPDIGDLGVVSMRDAHEWQLLDVERSGDDVLTIYERRRG